MMLGTNEGGVAWKTSKDEDRLSDETKDVKERKELKEMAGNPSTEEGKHISQVNQTTTSALRKQEGEMNQNHHNEEQSPENEMEKQFLMENSSSTELEKSDMNNGKTMSNNNMSEEHEGVGMMSGSKSRQDDHDHEDSNTKNHSEETSSVTENRGTVGLIHPNDFWTHSRIKTPMAIKSASRRFF